MKAFVRTEYGSPDVLQLEDTEIPVPGDNQVLVKVHAASVNPVDYHGLRGPIVIRLINRELRRPKNPLIGTDLAGVVEAVGKNVTQFKPGDAVFGVTRGAFAEYALAGEHKLTLKPNNITFEAAAAVPVAGLTALQALRDKCRVRSGQKVLINGASGGVGTFAIQIAKAYGAEVTAVCSTRNLSIARSIGADHVIDYTRENFTKNGQQYDVIMAINGFRPILAYRRSLAPEGIYISAGGKLRQVLAGMLWGRLLSKFGSKTLDFMGIATTGQEDLDALRDLLNDGKIIPVIDSCYPLSETPEALRYLGEGHAKGKVVISMTHSVRQQHKE